MFLVSRAVNNVLGRPPVPIPEPKPDHTIVIVVCGSAAGILLVAIVLLYARRLHEERRAQSKSENSLHHCACYKANSYRTKLIDSLRSFDRYLDLRVTLPFAGGRTATFTPSNGITLANWLS